MYRSLAGEFLAVTNTYVDPVAEGDVEHLSIVVLGRPRVTLATLGRVAVTGEMVQHLVAAQADPGLVRYQLEASTLGQSVEVTLAAGGLDEVVTQVSRYRRDEAVTRVSVRSADLVLSVDDSTWEVDLADERVRLMQDVDERFGPYEVVVAYPDSMGMWLDPSVVDAVRRLVTSRRTGYAYVHAVR